MARQHHRQRRGAGAGREDHVAHPRPGELVHEGTDVGEQDLLVSHSVSAPSIPSAASIGRSFTDDSAYSRSGSESPTMPQPATSDASAPSTSAERSATATSP